MIKLNKFKKVLLVFIFIINILCFSINYSYAEGPGGVIISIIGQFIDPSSFHLKPITMQCTITEVVPGVGVVIGYGYYTECKSTTLLSVCDPTPCQITNWVYPPVDVEG